VPDPKATPTTTPNQRAVPAERKENQRMVRAGYTFHQHHNTRRYKLLAPPTPPPPIPRLTHAKTKAGRWARRKISKNARDGGRISTTEPGIDLKEHAMNEHDNNSNIPPDLSHSTLDDAEQLDLFSSIDEVRAGAQPESRHVHAASAVLAESKATLVLEDLHLGTNVGERQLVDAADGGADAGHIRRMTRERIVGRILELNPSASAEFLEEFDDDELHNYLRRLNYSKKPRDSKARWIRETTDPGIEWRDRAA